MDKQNQAPSLAKLQEVLQKLRTGKVRIVKIEHSRAFYTDITSALQEMQVKSEIISFSDLIDAEAQPASKSNLLFSLGSKVIRFITELSPVVALMNFLCNLALDSFGYYLKQSEVKQLKSQLHIKKKPGKYKKIKSTIVVSDVSALTLEQSKFLSFLSFLIEKRYITSTALLILSESSYVSEYNITGVQSYKISFEAEDFEYYTQEKPQNPFWVEIIDKIGVEYINKIQKISEDSAMDKTEVIKEIIQLLIRSKGDEYDLKQIDFFLKVCSLLFEEFHLFDLQFLETEIPLKHLEMLPLSVKAKLLKGTDKNTYFFTEIFFREYYQRFAELCLKEADYNIILDYLKSKYPKQYVDIAITSCFMPLNEFEQLSYFIVAYYYKKDQKLKFQKTIVEFLAKTALGQAILKLEKYREQMGNFDVPEAEYAIQKALTLIEKINSLQTEAKLCTLNYAADVAYEIVSEQNELIRIFNLYLNFLTEIKIFSNPQERYVSYVLDAISFSTCIENYQVQKQTNRLVEWVNNISVNDIDNQIRFYKLGNLLYTFDSEKAIHFTRMAFEISENNIIRHEETRINYSVSLMGKGLYPQAYKILSLAKVMTPDYQKAYQNNIIIAGFLVGKYSALEIQNQFKNLILNDGNALTSDDCIILNNYISAQLLADCFKEVDVINNAGRIIQTGDKYHTFYAMHNLLLLYYLKKDKVNFIKLKSEIDIPYLMRKNKEIIEKKLQFMERFFDEYSTLESLQNGLCSLREETYSNNLIITPVIWGMMERWIK